MQEKVDLRVDWATHEAAKYACEKFHYSKCIPHNKLVKFGVWENEKFIGCVIYGVGASNSLVKQYNLNSTEGCELVRIALTKHLSTVTRIVSITLKMLKQTFKGLRLVVSFADPEQGHVGAIYQAGNWVYTGKSLSGDEYLINGKWMHGRALRKTLEKYKIDGANTRERASKFYGVKDIPERKGTSKYRYLMPLDKKMKKQIEPLRKPYPKKQGTIDGGIQE